jgi:hypothetical protein
MITAVDTSVLLDVFTADARHLAASQTALRRVMLEGSLIVCEVVVAELRPCFSTREDLARALDKLSIDFSPMSLEAALLAGETWKKYRESRGTRNHLVPDFLVAAHAVTTADRLCTRDRGFYRRWFKGLTILSPTTA